jgi:hypothetical protein
VANLIARFTDPRMFVDATTVDILDEEMAVFEPDYARNGILDARPEGSAAAVISATEIGELNVTAELWDGAPPLETDGWEDVAEVPVRWHTGVMEIGGEGTSLDEEPLLPIPGPGDYRIRVSGRNRDYDDPRDESDPAEEYLIQVWPSDGTRDSGVTHKDSGVTHKQTSRIGSRRRGEG